MRRSFLLMIVTAASLRATSVTSVTCTLGSTTITSSSSCSIPYVAGGMGGNVVADASISGFGPSEITAGADAGAGPPDPGVAWSASGTASDIEVFETGGPVRPGVIALSISGFGGMASASLTQGGTIFGIGTDGCCFPFELGTAFEVSVFAGAGGAGGPANAQDSSASISFFLFEADGTTPVPFSSVATPEPSTWGFLLFGLSACAIFHSRARGSG